MPENDAISRRQAVSRMSDLICLELKGKCPTWNDVYKAMNELPTVEPELLKEQKEVVHIEKDVTYPADMLTPGDVMASIGFNEQIAGHIGEMLLENGAVSIETFEGNEGPYHMVRFHLSADVVKQKKEGEQE